jgi:ribosomal protein L11 methylase PrmA
MRALSLFLSILHLSAAGALHLATISCAPNAATRLAAAALEAGALHAAPSAAGSVVLLLPPACCQPAWFATLGAGAVEPAELEPLWEPDDWHDAAAASSFAPHRVGASPLRVRPLPLDPRDPAAADDVLLLEHPHAFLTTSAGKLHVSTLLVLELLAAYTAELREARALLDFGCGSGVLSLAALALGAGGSGLRAFGVDVHDAAICAARRNAALNAHGGHAEFGFAWELPAALRVGVAVANMMPGPLCSVAPELVQRTRAGGLLLLSGFREADLPALRAAFEPHFQLPAQPTLRRAGRADEAGGRWLALACRRAEGTRLETDQLSESAVG